MQSVDPVICLLDNVQQVRVFTKNGVRLDGRDFAEQRALNSKQSFLSSGTQGVIGSSHVQIGSTVVACGLTLMVGVPSVAKPDAGDAVCNCVLTVGCDPTNLDQRSKNALASLIESTILSIVTKGNIFDFEQLGIMKGRFAYRICINLTCISNGGNLLDVAILAAMTALADAKLPLPVHSNNSIQVNYEVLRPLVLEQTCVPVTVGMVDGALLLDPSEEEEPALQGSLTCVFAMPSKSLCFLRQRGGGANWSVAQVEAAVASCLRAAESLHRQLLSPQARKQ